MNHVDHPEILAIEWFFGAGGNHLGIAHILPGLRLVAACEIEGYALANLVAKMEAGSLASDPLWTDVRTFPCHQFRHRIALFVASYPCQPFSTAGRRDGEADPRHLWPHVRAGVRAMRPARCFFENVEGHVSLGLSTVLSDLEEMGYRATWGLFSAEEVGASHRRKRVFIMADDLRQRFPWPRFYQGSREEGRGTTDAGGTLKAMANAERIAGARHDETLHGGRLPDGTRPEDQGHDVADARSNRWNEGSQDLCGSESFAPICGEAMADASSERLQIAESASESASRSASQFLRPHFPPEPSDLDLWREILAHDPSLEPALCRVADGLAHRVDRLRLCGNGVVPDTAALAWLTLDRELSL